MQLTKEIKRGLFLSLFLTIWLRVVIFLLGLYFLQFGLSSYLQNQAMNFVKLIPPENAPWYLLIQPLHRFDALWYEAISQDWYSHIPQSAAFFPLYPLLVSSLGKLADLGFAQSAFVLNTVLSFLFFFLFYLLTLKEHGEKAARQALFIYSIFPAVFFLLTPYAEVLLLVFVLCTFLFVSVKRYTLAILFAALAAMTKPFAVFVSIPILFIFVRDKHISHKFLKFSLFGLIPLAFLLVILFQDRMTGVAFSTMKAQTYWSIRFAWPWEVIVAEMKYIWRNQYSLPNHINILLVLIGSFFLVAMRTKVKTEYFLYTLILYLVFFLTSFKQKIIPFVSFSRFFLTLFPIFMFAGTLKVNSILKLLYCMVSFGLLVFLFILYASGIFVA